MKNYKLLILFLLPLLLSADKVLLMKNIDAFDVDIAGNIFIKKGATILKFSSTLTKKASFTDYSLGNITSFEAEDALNFFIFYSSNGKIIFLDNNLSVKRSPIDLIELGYPQATLACPSYNTGFWIYSPVVQQLVRFNRLLEKSQTTGNLSQITGETINPVILRETGDYVFLADTTAGVFVFDRYGAFLRKIPIGKVIDFQLISTKLNLLCSDTLFSYDMKTLWVDTVAMPFKNMIKFKYTSSNFYYQNNSGELFKVKIE